VKESPIRIIIARGGKGDPSRDHRRQGIGNDVALGDQLDQVTRALFVDEDAIERFSLAAFSASPRFAIPDFIDKKGSKQSPNKQEKSLAQT
jgi:hypothetical protein